MQGMQRATETECTHAPLHELSVAELRVLIEHRRAELRLVGVGETDDAYLCELRAERDRQRRAEPQRPADRRFSIAEIERRFPNMTTRQFALRLNVWPRTIEKWRHTGVDCWTADRIATAFELYAEQVWDTWSECADALAEAAEPPALFDDLIGV